MAKKPVKKKTTAKKPTTKKAAPKKTPTKAKGKSSKKAKGGFPDVASLRMEVTKRVDLLEQGFRGLDGLNASDGRKAPKPRMGGEPYARSMDELVIARPDLFKGLGIQPKEISFLWDRSEARVKLAEWLAAKAALVANSNVWDRGSSWKKALDVYDMARKLMANNPELESAVKAFEKFLATGKREEEEEPPATTPAPPGG